MNNKNIQKISLEDKFYPFLLKQIPDPPPVLYFLGNSEILSADSRPHLAIVGTRKATSNGCLVARNLAKELGAAGCIIVSGLAMGIDTSAHEGALAGGGKTIAVLGNGLNEIYPRQNENLAKEILNSGGLIISEYAPDEPAFPSNFLARNRIVSGLCQAAIVIEAPERSGSLVTARLALEQNREVFVVPGPANHFNYVGSHKLLREGARLASRAADILEDLNLETSPEELRPEEKLIIKTLSKNRKPLSLDKITELTKLESQTVNKNLAFLIIEGVIEENLGRYSLKK